MIYTLGELTPDIADDVFIADNAIVIGCVSIASQASVWYGTVLRGDNDEIEIGERSNIQDGSVIHVDEGVPTRIGNDVSIGHNTMIHGCTIGDNCLIGINATVMDGAVIGDNCIVAGGAFVKERTVVPANSIVMGIPAKAVREQNNWVANRFNAWLYEHNARAYARGEHRAWDGAAFLEPSKEKMTELQAEFAAL